jgi:ABC-type transporter Mla subunit MlaD
MKKVGALKSTDPFYYKHRNFFVGIFVLIPLLVIPALGMFILIRSEIFESQCTLHLKCETGVGLIPKKTIVNIQGMKVGRITSITLNEKGYVDVDLKFKRKYRRFVHKDSKAYLKQKNFIVGDWEIDLTGGEMDSLGNAKYPVVEDDDTLQVKYQIRLEKMVEAVIQMFEVAKKMITPLEKIILSIENGEGVLKYIFGEDTVMTDVHAIVGRANNLISSVNRTLANADGAIDNLSALGVHGIVTVDTLMVFAQEAGRLIDNLDMVVEDVDSLISGFDNLPEDIDSLVIMLKKDVKEADILLKAIKNHWLFRRAVQRQMRKEEKEMGER